MRHLMSRNELELENGDSERSSWYGLGLLLLTLVLVLAFAAPVLAAEKPKKDELLQVISFTNVDPGKTLIDINGENLHNGANDPTVILGLNGKDGSSVDIPLTVQLIGGPGTQVIADLPEFNPLTNQPFADGTYLITVNGAEFHAVFGTQGPQGNPGTDPDIGGSGGVPIFQEEDSKAPRSIDR